LTDTTLFPELGDTPVLAKKMNIVPIIDEPTDLNDDPNDCIVPAQPWYIPDESDSGSGSGSMPDTIPSGWILLTSADARKPIPRPVIDPGSESEDDEDTMPMTTAKRVPKPKTRTEPYIEWTGAEILELFRIDVARHDREVADRENDLYDDYSDDDELDWARRTDPYLGTMDDYADDDDDDADAEYYEYEGMG
jgi:hypothetical protein